MEEAVKLLLKIYNHIHIEVCIVSNDVLYRKEFVFKSTIDKANEKFKELLEKGAEIQSFHCIPSTLTVSMTMDIDKLI